MVPTLKFSCSEDWDRMKIGLVSRHCEQCDKEVKDFTKMSREEVLLYLLQNRDKEVCARLLPSQVDYHHRDLVLVIENLMRKHSNSNLAFYLLTIGSLTLLGCDTSKNIERAATDTIAITIDSSAHSIDSVKLDTDITSDSIPDLSSEITYTTERRIDTWVMGFVAMHAPTIDMSTSMPVDDPLGLRQPPFIAQVMPAFPGGFDSLVSFLKKNVKYPETEKKKAIEGTTYVSVTIDESGKLKDALILNSPSENFSKEARRVVSLMPDWIPAENDSIKTAVRYTIPIQFKL